jgi:hypothetical protein
VQLKILFLISGKKFWVHDGNRFEPDSPGFLSDLGLPAGLDQLDAAFVWGKNQKTYFFRNNLYWKFDDKVGYLQWGYKFHTSPVFKWSTAETRHFNIGTVH